MNIKLILLTAATALGLASCNTISGIGKDVESMGSKIDSASPATSRSMQQKKAARLSELHSGTLPVPAHNPWNAVQAERPIFSAKRAASPFPEKRLLNIQRLAVLHGTACSPGGGIDIVADGFHIPAPTADRMAGNAPKKGGDA